MGEGRGVVEVVDPHFTKIGFEADRGNVSFGSFWDIFFSPFAYGETLADVDTCPSPVTLGEDEVVRWVIDCGVFVRVAPGLLESYHMVFCWV